MAMNLGKEGQLVSEINVTPFVDVMLVLLIIFMVATPMMTEGLEVDLPQTRQVEVLPTDADHLILTVRRDGRIYLDEYAINDMADLEGYLLRLVKEKNRSLFLQADKEVPYGLVVEVMGQIKAAGIENLGVMAEQSSSPNQQAAPMTGAMPEAQNMSATQPQPASPARQQTPALVPPPVIK